MCIICELKKAAEGIAEDIMREVVGEVVAVGTVSGEIMDKFKEFSKERALLEIDLQEAVAKEERQAIESGKGKLSADQRNRLQQLEDKWNKKLDVMHSAAWEAVYAELSLDPNEGYRINHDTGEVVQVVNKQDAPVAEGLH